jgi:hypothetical protein
MRNFVSHFSHLTPFMAINGRVPINPSIHFSPLGEMEEWMEMDGSDTPTASAALSAPLHAHRSVWPYLPRDRSRALRSLIHRRPHAFPLSEALNARAHEARSAA